MGLSLKPVWSVLTPDTVRISLNCSIPGWCYRELLVVGEKLHISDVGSIVHVVVVRK